MEKNPRGRVSENPKGRISSDRSRKNNQKESGVLRESSRRGDDGKSGGRVQASFPAVVNRWERVLAVGCSHGTFANQDALRAVLRFRDEWKPKHRIHLGDAYDSTAFRTGALGGKDSDCTESVHDDITHGGKFLRDFAPTVFCLGNHEQRLVRLSEHYNEIVAMAAQATLERMMDAIGDAPIIEYTVHEKGWFTLGGYKFGHGHLYGENYLRDTAETWGNTVVAHAHRAGSAKGRRSDNPTAFGVGTLADIPAMGYASGRRATLAWSHGFVWGEVCGDKASLHVHEWQQGDTEWRLPI